MKITKEQVKELNKNTTSKGQDYLKQWFPEAFKTELEVGKWYKNTDSGYEESIAFATKLHSETPNNQFAGYGFDMFKGWVKSDTDTELFGSKKWRLATPQEVESALIAEAKKRGYEEAVYVVSLENKNIIHLIKGDFYFGRDGNLYYKGAMIFKTGKWATIIPTLTKAEAEEKLGVKII